MILDMFDPDTFEWVYVRPADPRLAAEYDAFRAMFADLVAARAGQYVAVSGGQVVAAGPTLDGVFRKVKATHGHVPAYLVRVHAEVPEVRIGGMLVLEPGASR